MRRSPALLAFALALLVAALAGCGSTSTTTTGSDPADTATSAPSETSETSATSTVVTTTAPPTTSSTVAAPDPTTSTTTDVSTAPDIVLGQHRLPADQPVDVGGGASLRLVELEDSRCPPDVMCVWAGELKAGVVWTDDGSETPLDLTWVYVADPTPLPGTDLVLALEDADGDVAVVTIRAA